MVGDSASDEYSDRPTEDERDRDRPTIYLTAEEFARRVATLGEPRPEDSMSAEFAASIKTFEDLEDAIYRMFGHEPPSRP